MTWQQSCIDWLAAAQREWQRGNLRVAVIAAHTAVSQACEAYMRSTDCAFKSSDRRFSFPVGIEKLVEYQKIDASLEQALDELNNKRNQATHYPYDAPPPSRIQNLIEAAAKCLSILGVDSRSLTKARLEGTYFKVSWPKAEVVKLAHFQSQQLGFTALCPVDWDHVREGADHIAFYLQPKNWKQVYHHCCGTGDLAVDLIFHRLSAVPKILSFRRVTRTNETSNLTALVRHDIPSQIPIGHCTIVSQSLSSAAGFEIVRIKYFEDDNYWNGEFRIYKLPNEGEFVVGFHQWTGFGDAWLPMCDHIVDRLLFVDRHELNHKIVARAQESFVSLVNQSHPELQPTTRDCVLRSREDEDEQIHVHFAARGSNGNPQMVGVVEWPSNIVRGKIERWKKLEELAEDVVVYVPAPFANEVRRLRHEIGFRTQIFMVRSGDNGSSAVERVSL